jgi:arylsulfatase A-like enzyme
MLEGLAYLALQRWEILEWDVALVSVGPQQVFVSAAVNVVLFLAMAFFLTLIGSRVTWKSWPSVTLGLFLFLSFLALVDLSGRIQMRASLLLALGLTVQAVHWIGPRRDKVLWFMRGSLLPLAGATALAGLAAWLGGPVFERVQASRLPSYTGAPSVLLIVLDTLRPDHLSGYGYDRPTSPNLDALAAQGIRFEHAYASSSWTLPTHATLMTGLLPSEHGATVRRNRSPLRTELPVLSEAMAARGYLTAGFVANDTWLTPWMGLHRGFLHYESYYYSLLDAVRRSYYGRQMSRRLFARLGIPNETRLSALQINTALLQWIDHNPGRPFFAFLNYMEAHAPNPVPASFGGRFHGASAWSKARLRAKTLTAEEITQREEWIGRYDTAVSYLDAQLEELFAELRRRGLLESMVIIVTSDHGEMFGRHHLFDHGNSLYEEVIHVPLIFRIPGGAYAGRQVAQRVSLRDVPATVLSLAGATGHSLGGQSLAEFWESSAPPPRPVIAEVDGAPFPGVPEDWPVRNGWLKSITLEQWKLIVHEQGSAELFDLEADPLERNNLARQPEHKERVEQLQRLLAAGLGHKAKTGESD